MQLPHALRALKHRNYQLFFSGQLISLIGTWMQSVAQMWLVYRLSRSSLLLGAVGFASQIPVFLLAAFGGMLADTLDRRRLLIGTQTASMVLAGILAALTLSGAVRIWHVFVLAALLGIVNAVDIPSRQAFVADLVARDHLMNAIALNSSMFNGARVVGPAVAGVLVAVSMLGMPYAVLMPIFADQILHAGAHGLGVLMGFSGAGALLGAIALALKNRVQGLGLWVTVSAGMFGVALVGFAFSRRLWLSCLLIVCTGFFMMVQMSSSNTLIQSMVPDRLRGRVMAVYSMMFMGMAPLGSLLAGMVADHLGAPRTVA